jgi:hypothetical protein
MAWINITTDQGELVDRIEVEDEQDLDSPLGRAMLAEEITNAIKVARRIEARDGAVA